jgi:endonuclease/exonuclease/phosphatase family metal-dependent hydrolase
MKFLTWNILGGSNYIREIEYIKTINPDIFCLQEVQINYPGYYGDVPTNVLKAFQDSFPDYDNAYAPINYLSKDGLEHSFGNAIFSRFPIINKQALYFRKQPDWTTDDHQNQARNLLIAELKCDGNPLTVATCHLTYEPGFIDTPQQVEESQLILEALEHKPNVILAGDFNSLPNSHVIKNINAKFSLAPSQDFLTFARIRNKLKNHS